MSPVSDEGRDRTDALVRRAQAGDRSAFAELVRRYRARIYALTLHLTGSRAEADDITQDVFTRAYQELGRFAGRSELFTWLYRIAVNRSLNARRNTARRRTRGLDDPRVQAAVAVDAYGDPRRAAELRQTYARLIVALDRLSPALRSTVVLVALQGLAHDAAAAVLGCTAGTVAWRIHQARRQLRQALDLDADDGAAVAGARPTGASPRRLACLTPAWPGVVK